jgi:hypothetical protein
MASITVSRPDLFPVGTTVSAYVDPGRGTSPTSGPPPGSSVASGTVAANGSLTISGLANATNYVLYASSPDRYLRVYAANPVASGGGGVQLGVFTPEDYGAVADVFGAATNSRQALKDCMQDVVTQGVAVGSPIYCGVIDLTPGGYYVGGALTQGGATKGNAALPLPVLPDTGQKFIFVFRSPYDMAPLWHWNQTSKQRAGAFIITDIAGTADVTYGRASLIGGPTPEQGYGQATNVWSNMLVVVDGVQLVVPNNPAICGFDFRGVAEMNVKSGSVFTDATPATKVDATNAWQFGLATPETNNNAVTRIGHYAAEGVNYGLMANEHLVAESVSCVYCVAGVEFGTHTASAAHGMVIDRLLVEASQVGIGAAEGGFPLKVRINEFSWENLSFAVINDPSDFLMGQVYTSGIGAANLLVDAPAGNVNYGIRGARNVSVYDMGRQKGVQTSPGIPASTTALRNPFFRDAFVHINGGTVSLVQITDSGGTARTVATTTGVPVLLPTGAYITLTYSVVPTSWTWTIT